MDLVLEQLNRFENEHRIYSPHGESGKAGHVTDGVTVCSCGAKWRTYYSAKGLEWIPLNDLCQDHDDIELALPRCMNCGGKLGYDETGSVFCIECGSEY